MPTLRGTGFPGNTCWKPFDAREHIPTGWPHALLEGSPQLIGLSGGRGLSRDGVRWEHRHWPEGHRPDRTHPSGSCRPLEHRIELLGVEHTWCGCDLRREREGSGGRRALERDMRHRRDQGRAGVKSLTDKRRGMVDMAHHMEQVISNMDITVPFHK